MNNVVKSGDKFLAKGSKIGGWVAGAAVGQYSSINLLIPLAATFLIVVELFTTSERRDISNPVPGFAQGLIGSSAGCLIPLALPTT